MGTWKRLIVNDFAINAWAVTLEVEQILDLKVDYSRALISDQK